VCDSAEKFMFTENDATAPLRVSLILTKEAAPDIISRKINGANRDGAFSTSSENFDHLISMSVDCGECQVQIRTRSTICRVCSLVRRSLRSTERSSTRAFSTSH
jgi:hypothetical protein